MVENKKIIFDKNSRELILELFDKTTDKEGYIIQKSNNERVLTKNGEEIHINDFAVISKGSEIFTKSDLSSLIDFAIHSGNR